MFAEDLIECRVKAAATGKAGGGRRHIHVEQGLSVEVFSNLVHVTDDVWEILSQPGVSLATSYYSDQPEQHAAITGRASYARTKGNIVKAIRRGIPLRVGVIDLGAGQRVHYAQEELKNLGVRSVGYDLLRQIGRGVRDQRASAEQLCGHCGRGNLSRRRRVAVRIFTMASNRKRTQK